MLVKDTTAHHAYWIKAILEAQGAKHVIRQVVLMAVLCNILRSAQSVLVIYRSSFGDYLNLCFCLCLNVCKRDY